MNDNIDEVLNIEQEEIVEELSVPAIPRPIKSANDTDVDIDYQYQRENLYHLIERGQDAIEGILEVAKEGEHPRAYEVAGNMIKNVADITDKLMDLQSKVKKVKEDEPKKNTSNVNNNLFIGSTAELQKFLNNRGAE